MRAEGLLRKSVAYLEQRLSAAHQGRGKMLRWLRLLAQHGKPLNMWPNVWPARDPAAPAFFAEPGKLAMQHVFEDVFATKKFPASSVRVVGEADLGDEVSSAQLMDAYWAASQASPARATPLMSVDLQTKSRTRGVRTITRRTPVLLGGHGFHTQFDRKVTATWSGIQTSLTPIGWLTPPHQDAFSQVGFCRDAAKLWTMWPATSENLALVECLLVDGRFNGDTAFLRLVQLGEGLQIAQTLDGDYIFTPGLHIHAVFTLQSGALPGIQGFRTVDLADWVAAAEHMLPVLRANPHADCFDMLTETGIFELATRVTEAKDAPVPLRQRISALHDELVRLGERRRD